MDVGNLRVKEEVMQGKSDVPSKTRVIVRSWGDEPVALFLQRIENDRVYVHGDKSSTAIGIPTSQVFRFNRGDFADLVSAYKAGDMDRLSSIYFKLSVNSSCNRYQDILESPHDKEHISDSGSTASSSER